MVLCIGSGEVLGQKNPPTETDSANRPVKTKTADGDNAADELLVKAVIATSRPEVTTSGTFGVYADLQNLASEPITLFPREVTLVVQPEVGRNPDCVFEYDAFFPTEPNVATAAPLGGPIVIPPKEHYQAFWGLGTGEASCLGEAELKGVSAWVKQRAKNLKSFVGFLPGDYGFSVIGKAYLTPDGKKANTYHTFVQTAKLHVGITQLQSMVAAMIGGLLAYFVVGLREGGELRTLKREESDNKRSSLSKWGVILRSLASAALLSSVVTIILSRLSETQFPIKISVSDFWGALTVGFIAYFTGNKIIDRIVDLGGGSGSTQPTPPNRPDAPVQPPQQDGAGLVGAPPAAPADVPG